MNTVKYGKTRCSKWPTYFDYFFFRSFIVIVLETFFFFWHSKCYTSSALTFLWLSLQLMQFSYSACYCLALYFQETKGTMQNLSLRILDVILRESILLSFVFVIGKLKIKGNNKLLFISEVNLVWSFDYFFTLFFKMSIQTYSISQGMDDTDLLYCCWSKWGS